MTVAAPEPKANMGQPVPRYDARLKVTGEARYPSDVPVSNPAYAFLVTSRIAKGRLEQLDLAEARAVPGVLDILTQDNTSELKSGKFGGNASTSIDKLGPEIAHDGQIIAMVLADSYEAAREAAYKVKATYAAGRAERDLRIGGPRGRGRDQGLRTTQEGPEQRRCRRGARGRRRGDRRGVRDADPASQSDRAVHHDLRLDRRQADGL